MEAPPPENSQPGFSKDFGQHFLQSYGIFPNICHRQGLTCHCWYPWGYPKNLVICHQNGLQTASLRIHIYIYILTVYIYKILHTKDKLFHPIPNTSQLHPNLRIHICTCKTISLNGGWIRIPKRSFLLFDSDTSPGAQVHCTGALTLQAWWIFSAGNVTTWWL